MAGKPLVVRGLDCILYINGRVFGIATGIDWDASTGAQARYGIDQQTPFEILSTQASIRGTVECLRHHNTAGVEGAGIVPEEEALSRARYFFLQLVDRQTDTVILQVPKAALINQRWSVKARGVMTGSFTFEGLAWSNEY
jgi:hypothetical protein